MTYYIYAIINTINWKIYIGQTENLSGRKSDHKGLQYGSKKHRHLYSAIAKYGWENFDMFSFDQYETLEEIDIAEIFWIDFFDSRNREIGYNKAIGGRVNRGWNHTDQWKREQAERKVLYFATHKPKNAKLTDRQVKNIRKLYKSAIYSTRELATKYKIDTSGIKDIVNNKTYKDKNYSLSVEEKKLITDKLLSNNRPRKEIRNEMGMIFSSMSAAARYYNVSDDTIRYRIKNPNSKSKTGLPKLYWI